VGSVCVGTVAVRSEKVAQKCRLRFATGRFTGTERGRHIHRHLEDTANEKLGFAPPIFAVSARKALLSRTTGLDKERLWQESNFGQLEDHISMMVGHERTRMLKLASTCQTASLILSDSANESALVCGRSFATKRSSQDCKSTLQARKDQTLRQIAGFCVESSKRAAFAKTKASNAATSAVFLADVADWSSVERSGNTNFKRSWKSKCASDSAAAGERSATPRDRFARFSGRNCRHDESNSRPNPKFISSDDPDLRVLQLRLNQTAHFDFQLRLKFVLPLRSTKTSRHVRQKDS